MRIMMVVRDIVSYSILYAGIITQGDTLKYHKNYLKT